LQDSILAPILLQIFPFPISADLFLTSGKGTANLASVTPPLLALGGSDGAGQMEHFANDDGLNLFRLREFHSTQRRSLTENLEISCELAVLDQQQ
jgi:hypothetical protein